MDIHRIFGMRFWFGFETRSISMRLFTQEVFRQTVDNTVEQKTPATYNSLLGSAEKIVLHIIATRATLGGTNNLQLNGYGSNDGKNWVPLQSGSPLFTSAALSNTGVNNFTYTYGSTNPPFSFMQFGVLMGAGTVADVQIIACGRAESGSS
jgi:hypothetical protein